MDPIESLYIHFPFCLKRCNYCDFFSQLKGTSHYLEYQQLLDRQLQWLSSYHREQQAELLPFKSVYIGGGTPGLWGRSGRLWLKEFFKKYPLASNCEFTIELNPGAISRAEIEEWMELGVNRFSVGSQSLDPYYLKALDRIHSREQTLELLTLLKQVGVNHSVDLMLGLPFTETHGRNLVEELQPLFELQIPHLSAYILTVDEDYCHFDQLPQENRVADEYQALAKMMKEHGYHHYEVSNFALPGRESFHNLEYWKNRSVAALGPSAVGTIIKPGLTRRYRFDPQSGEAQLEVVTGEAQKIEEVFMGLRSAVGVPLELLDQSESGRQLLALWQENGWGHIDAKRVILSSQGLLLLDSLIDQLFQRKII